jgi:hypothetical protein
VFLQLRQVLLQLLSKHFKRVFFVFEALFERGRAAAKRGLSDALTQVAVFALVATAYVEVAGVFCVLCRLTFWPVNRLSAEMLRFIIHCFHC